MFTDNDVHVSFSDGFAAEDQTTTIVISNCVFTGDCDYSIWGFPQDDLSSYNSNIDLFICSNVFYDDNDINLHIVGGGDYGDIDVESYNNIFHTSTCGLGAADDVDAAFNLGYNTSTAYMGNDVITDDPEMNDPGNGDFTLATNSPCIDTGGDEFECQYLPEFDHDGTTPDIGTFYYHQAPAVPTGFNGVWYNNHPKVYWNAVNESDLKHYEVWKKKGAGAWALRTTTTSTNYTDNSEFKWTKPGDMITIYYKVRSVDDLDYTSSYTLNESFLCNAPQSDKERFFPAVEIDPIPTELNLHPVFPNPFNITTTIKLDLPEKSNFSLAIYDIKGSEIWRLNNRRTNSYRAGYHTIVWEGRNNFGTVVPTGVYFIVYNSPEHKLNQKVVLMK